MLRSRVEAPLERVAREESSTRNAAVAASLGLRPNVDQNRSFRHRDLGLNGIEPLEPRARLVQQILDGHLSLCLHDGMIPQPRELDI